jgi:hypothetical protein
MRTVEAKGKDLLENQGGNGSPPWLAGWPATCG